MMDYRESPYLVEVFDFDLLHLELNTPLFIFALILVVMFFLRRWLFVPVLTVMDNRDAQFEKLEETIDTNKQQLAQLQADWEKESSEAHQKMAQIRQDTLKESSTEAERIRRESREKALSAFQAGAEAMEKEKAQLQGVLSKQQAQFVAQLCKQVLQ